MQVELGLVEAEDQEELRRAIGTTSVTATIRAFGAMFSADKNFRDDVIAAAKRMNVDKDGKLPK